MVHLHPLCTILPDGCIITSTHSFLLGIPWLPMKASTTWCAWPCPWIRHHSQTILWIWQHYFPNKIYHKDSMGWQNKLLWTLSLKTKSTPNPPLDNNIGNDNQTKIWKQESEIMNLPINENKKLWNQPPILPPCHHKSLNQFSESISILIPYTNMDHCHQH